VGAFFEPEAAEEFVKELAGTALLFGHGFFEGWI